MVSNNKNHQGKVLRKVDVLLIKDSSGYRVAVKGDKKRNLDVDLELIICGLGLATRVWQKYREKSEKEAQDEVVARYKEACDDAYTFKLINFFE